MNFTNGHQSHESANGGETGVAFVRIHGGGFDPDRRASFGISIHNGVVRISYSHEAEFY
jgi:hypothetical protein